MSTSRSNADVVVVGMGYVGLTLAAAFAQAGLDVIGYEADRGRLTRLQRKETPFREPGLQETLDEFGGSRLVFVDSMPDPLPRSVVVCVGTPVNPDTHEPHLGDLRASAADVASHADEDTLVVVRSTVPVGGTREIVEPELKKRISKPLLAYCPERTIQGQALRELAELPQVVGGEPAARARAAELFGRVTNRIVEVSSLEAAELCKLVNNAHTDLIYGFGNEVALITAVLGLDAHEVIRAANIDYPRPDLAGPGYVGGSCLIKDPYILLGSARGRGYEPALVAAARALNEHVPVHVARQVVHEFERAGLDPADKTVVVSGIAYKGRPETDDVRGSAAPGVVDVLAPRVGRLLGHDFVVEDDVIAGFGLEPCELAAGCEDAAALIVLNDHPAYRQYSVSQLIGSMSRPRAVYDLWGALERSPADQLDGGVYLRLGAENERR